MNLFERLCGRIYDRNEYSDTVTEPLKWTALDLFEKLVPARGDVLDCCCGSGVSTTKRLSERYNVLAFDASKRQVELCRKNAPRAHVVQGFLGSIRLCYGYDGIVLANCLFNLSYRKQLQTLRLLRNHLYRQGVLLVSSYGDKTQMKFKRRWYGKPMVWYHLSDEAFEKMLNKAGLVVQSREMAVDRCGSQAVYIWLCRRDDYMTTTITDQWS